MKISSKILDEIFVTNHLRVYLNAAMFLFKYYKGSEILKDPHI